MYLTNTAQNRSASILTMDFAGDFYHYGTPVPGGAATGSISPPPAPSLPEPWANAPSSIARPQVMQKRQPTSSSVLHAGHWSTVTLLPQYGQKVMRRPSGSGCPQ